MTKLTLNVGGTLFQTTSATLESHLEGRLAKLNPQDDAYDAVNKQYFFDRNPEIFNSILDFYRYGELHLPNSYCGATFRRELEFWQIPEEKISLCCLQTFYRVENDKEVMHTLQEAFRANNLDYENKEMNSFQTTKRKVWIFLDQPTSSKAAKVFSIIYMVVVLLSMIVFICSTHQLFRVDFDPIAIVGNETFYKTTSFLDLSNAKIIKNVFMRPHPYLTIVDLMCTIFFSSEVILHFGTCPKLRRFFVHWLNVLDIFLCIVMWAIYALEKNLTFILSNQAGGILYLILRCLVILRPLRVFRLVKQYRSLKLLYLALRCSLRELCLLLITFMIASTMFSILIYYAEYGEPNTFESAFLGIWWSVITMTTVGYGDVLPISLQGRVVGIMCSMFGILILAMPVAIVATNFNDLHSKNKERERFERRTKETRMKFSSVSPLDHQVKDCF